MRAPRHLALVGLVIALAAITHAQQPTPDPLPSDPLFNSNAIQRVDLRVHSADWEKLKQSFQENTYYPADMVFNGETAHNTGIRSRGLGSRNARKPGLRVDFDRYTPDRTFKGLKSLVLDNLTQDRSGVHETVTMKLFAKLGVPAPREAHVRLYVNNAYIGLYAIVESIDKDFLARTFGKIGEDTQNDGYLYEFNYVNPWTFTYLGQNLDAYKPRFDPKTHENKSDAEKYGPLENLVRLANEVSVDQFAQSLGEHLDLPAFMRYVAAQNFIGENDGFLGYAGMNNFYFYRLENSSKHVFIAWDEDHAFWGPDFPIDMRHQENVLFSKAMSVAELRDEYNRTLLEAARLSDEATGADGLPWLEYETRRQLDLIYDALREDPSKPYTIEEHESERNAVIIFARDRSRSVRSQLGSSSARVRGR
jgi:spore coat protein CotH